MVPIISQQKEELFTILKMFLFFISYTSGQTSERLSYCNARESRALTSACLTYVRGAAR